MKKEKVFPMPEEFVVSEWQAFLMRLQPWKWKYLKRLKVFIKREMNQELEMLLGFIGIAILGFGIAYFFVYVLPEWLVELI